MRVTIAVPKNGPIILEQWIANRVKEAVEEIDTSLTVVLETEFQNNRRKVITYRFVFEGQQPQYGVVAEIRNGYLRMDITSP